MIKDTLPPKRLKCSPYHNAYIQRSYPLTKQYNARIKRKRHTAKVRRKKDRIHEATAKSKAK